jgi:hypothetical protein
MRLSLIRSGFVLAAITLALTSAPARAQMAPSQPMPPPQPAPASAATPAVAAPPANTSTVPPDPKIQAMAKDWLHRLSTNNIDRSQLADNIATKLTPDVATKTASQLAVIGDPSSFTYVGSQPGSAPGLTVYEFLATYTAVKLDVYFGLDAAGKVTALGITPAQ